MTYLFTGTSITSPTRQTRQTRQKKQTRATAKIEHTDQEIIQNVERHGDGVAFVNPFQPHAGS